jgi:probable rRNA maturation factor
MTVRVRTDGRPRARFSAARTRVLAARMLRALRLEEMELSVLLTDDAGIRALNRAHRAMDRPTDVLAFSQHEDEHGRFVGIPDAREGLLGDVVVSLDTARRDAERARIPLEHEISLLLAHGLLHLCGLDHRTRDETRRMQARTQLLSWAALAGPRRRSRDRA